MFVVRFTSQYKPAVVSPAADAVPAAVLATVTDFWDCQVEIPLDASVGRTGRFTMSVEDEAAQHIDPYVTMVQVFYRGNLELWGQITQPTWDLRAGTVTVEIRDRTLVLEHHFLRDGDEATIEVPAAFFYVTYTNIDGDDERTYGNIPQDSRGLRRVMWAARNTVDQTARGMPDLGVDLGTPWDTWGVSTSAYTPEKPFVGERGQQVLQTMADIGQNVDWNLEPWDTIDAHAPTATNPYYAKLNTFSTKGADDALSGPDSEVPTFDTGYQYGNLENVVFTPGGRIVTHAIVNAADNKTRTITADLVSSAETGAFVEWVTTDYRPSDTDSLDRTGAALIKAYGRPPHYLTLTVKADSDAYYIYGEHYTVGQGVNVRARRGQMVVDDSYRITKVTLAQRDRAGNSGAELEVAPQRVDDAELDSEDA